jgi:hypothetical protein
MFELAEERSTRLSCVGGRSDGSGTGWLRDVGLGAAGPDKIEQRIGVISAVGDDMAALQPFEQVGRSAQIVSLSCGEHEPYRQTVLIDQSVDLGAQSSTRAADGVFFAPFFTASGVLAGRG